MTGDENLGCFVYSNVVEEPIIFMRLRLQVKTLKRLRLLQNVAVPWRTGSATLLYSYSTGTVQMLPLPPKYRLER
jgi:hypothetical protein